MNSISLYKKKINENKTILLAYAQDVWYNSNKSDFSGQRGCGGIELKRVGCEEEAKRLRAEALADTEKILPQTLHEIFEEGKKNGWEEKTLPEISENLDSMRKPITRSSRKNGAYPYYGASGIVDHVDGYIFDEELILISEDGANLVARSTPIAFAATGKYWVNNHAHVLRFQDKTLQKIIEYYFNYIDVKPYVSGSAQPKLNQANLNKIKILIPPLAEQQKIVAKLDALSEKVRTLRDLQINQLADLKKIEKAYLREAFAGGGVVE